jgi:replicative DNA helicase
MSNRTGDLPRPHDIDTEQQLLGELLLDNAAAERLVGMLEPHHFAEPLHQRIYDAILRAVKAGGAATPFTLRTQFEADEAMRQLGGVEYLGTLAALAAGCISTDHWARALKNLAFRRSLIAMGRELQDIAAKAGIEVEPEALAAHAEELVTHATASAGESAVERFRPVGDIAAEALSRAANPAEAAVKFGLNALDEVTGGMRAKELVIVGARPGMGKTAFAGHVALAAARQGRGVAFFSMEMAAEAIALRLATATVFAEEGRTVAYDTARRGKLDANATRKLIEAEAKLRTLPLYIHEGRQLTPSGLLIAAKRAQKKLASTATPLGLVVVDHLQKIRPERDCKGNKVAEMTEISDALQKMAGTLGVPVVALSQLNRQSEARTDKRPELADLRESGAIEQDADLVLLLFREAYYVQKREPARHAPEWADWLAEYERCKHHLDIHIAKHRNGREATLRAHFDAPSSGLR